MYYLCTRFVRVYREHVCSLIVLSVYSMCLYRDPVGILSVLSVYACSSKPHLVVVQQSCGFSIRKFSFVVNDNFFQDEGGRMTGPLRPDPWHGRILFEYGPRVDRHRPIAEPMISCGAYCIRTLANERACSTARVG